MALGLESSFSATGSVTKHIKLPGVSFWDIVPDGRFFNAGKTNIWVTNFGVSRGQTQTCRNNVTQRCLAVAMGNKCCPTLLDSARITPSRWSTLLKPSAHFTEESWMVCIRHGGLIRPPTSNLSSEPPAARQTQVCPAECPRPRPHPDTGDPPATRGSGQILETMWKRCGNDVLRLWWGPCGFPQPFTGTPARQPAAPKLPFPKPNLPDNPTPSHPSPNPDQPKPLTRPHPQPPKTKPPLEVCLEALSLQLCVLGWLKKIKPQTVGSKMYPWKAN